MSEHSLTQVWRACRELDTAKARLWEAIRAARHDGASLRDIAVAAGMSYETVRRICKD